MAKPKAVIAAGNKFTGEAAVRTIEAGGNAFDAVVAAIAMSFVSEPVLSSPGGGGFLMARPAGQNPVIIDFFTQTPRKAGKAEALDFYPAHAHFGATSQEFHIGQGSVATPGMVAGLFHIHEKFCRLEMKDLFGPAVRLARVGHPFDRFQSEILRIVSPIMLSTDPSRAVFGSKQAEGMSLIPGEPHKVPDLGDFLSDLALKGADFFYSGEVAQLLATQTSEKGLMTGEDLKSYKVIEREPLEVRLSLGDFYTNPAPSSGGTLIGFALKLLEEAGAARAALNDRDWYVLLAEVMEMTNLVRTNSGFALDHSEKISKSVLLPRSITRYLEMLEARAHKAGGTTHISVVDAEGNLAAATLSNGEGSGIMVPGCGFMLNNMLGEEDINPRGFFNWEPNTRISSMMSPSYFQGKDLEVVLGSGGSNRIRSAIFQVLATYLFRPEGLQGAVDHHRLHFEDLLNIEGGFPDAIVRELEAVYEKSHRWSDISVFFGGVHAAAQRQGELEGAADRRRGGVVLSVS